MKICRLYVNNRNQFVIVDCFITFILEFKLNQSKLKSCYNSNILFALALSKCLLKSLFLAYIFSWNSFEIYMHFVNVCMCANRVTHVLLHIKKALSIDLGFEETVALIISR